MTAPLEVKTRLRELLGDYRGEYLGTLLRCDVTAILAAIEERDAEIERMEAEIDKRCCCEFKMPEGTPAESTCTFHDAQTDQIATLTRQLAESRAKLARYEKAEKEIWERTPGWLGEQLPALAAYLARVEAQRDAMRGTLREVRENLVALLAHHERRHDDAVRDGMREGVTRIDRALGAL